MRASVLEICPVHKSFRSKKIDQISFNGIMLKSILHGYVEIVEWFCIQKHYPNTVKPCQWDMDTAAEKGNLEILKVGYVYGIIPSCYGVNFAAAKGHIEILLWMEDKMLRVECDNLNKTYCKKCTPSRKGRKLSGTETLKIPRPTSSILGSVIGNNDIVVLNWCARQEPPILPSVDDINIAALNGFLEIVKWGFNRGICVNSDGLNFAKMNNRTSIIEYLSTQIIAL
ncbi:MAG: hypothetical protein JKX76_01955 [Colwellia sp.]|nr:hypothetical protein [Colwellia sp.]